MRVLVTRPAMSGARTAKKLEAMGHEPLTLPLTSAVHDLEATRTALAASSGAIAVTSGEAIRALQAAEASDARLGEGASPAAHRQRPLFAVGATTADMAVDLGFTIVHHSHGDGAALADLVADKRRLLGGRPLTYLAGFPRASGFEAGLAFHGIAFDTVECYRMEAIEPCETVMQRALGEPPVDAILFYSRETADRFFGLDLVAEDMGRLKNTRLLCLSATIATIVPYALRSRVEIAAIPEEDSLLHLLDADADPILI